MDELLQPAKITAQVSKKMGAILCHLQLDIWKAMELNELQEKGGSLLIGCKAKKNLFKRRECFSFQR